jgi:hypothetical protein
VGLAWLLSPIGFCREGLNRDISVHIHISGSKLMRVKLGVLSAQGNWIRRADLHEFPKTVND